MSGPGRYDTVGTATVSGADGLETRYLRRRFLPQRPVGPARLHIVGPGERVDLIAARELGDAERSWVLADANAVMRPTELSALGRLVRIPRPGGMAVTDRGQ